MTTAPEEIALNEVAHRLGRRIAELRSARGLTLEELAAIAGFTKGYISKIENGRQVPPIGTLIKLAQALGTEMADLLDQESNAERSDEICVVRAWQKEPITRGSGTFGYDYIALARKKHHKKMEPFVMIFPEEVSHEPRFDHNGEEFMFILQGDVEWEVDLDGKRKTWVLTKGDSIYFNSRLPHRGRSLKGEASALVVIYRDEDETSS